MEEIHHKDDRKKIVLKLDDRGRLEQIGFFKKPTACGEGFFLDKKRKYPPSI